MAGLRQFRPSIDALQVQSPDGSLGFTNPSPVAQATPGITDAALATLTGQTGNVFDYGAAIADAAGAAPVRDGLRQYSSRLGARAQRMLQGMPTRVEDSDADPEGYAKYLAGSTLGSAVPNMLAAAAGSMLSARVPGLKAVSSPLRNTIGAMFGAGAYNFPALAGGTARELYDNEEARANTTAGQRLGMSTMSGLAQSALEAAPEAFAVGKVAKAGMGLLRTPQHLLPTLAKNAVGEAATEIGQSAINRNVVASQAPNTYSASLADPEAFSEYLNSGVAGAAGGVGVGTVGHGAMRVAQGVNAVSELPDTLKQAGGFALDQGKQAAGKAGDMVAGAFPLTDEATGDPTFWGKVVDGAKAGGATAKAVYDAVAATATGAAQGVAASDPAQATAKYLRDSVNNILGDESIPPEARQERAREVVQKFMNETGTSAQELYDIVAAPVRGVADAYGESRLKTDVDAGKAAVIDWWKELEIDPQRVHDKVQEWATVAFNGTDAGARKALKAVDTVYDALVKNAKDPALKATYRNLKARTLMAKRAVGTWVRAGTDPAKRAEALARMQADPQWQDIKDVLTAAQQAGGDLKAAASAWTGQQLQSAAAAAQSAAPSAEQQAEQPAADPATDLFTSMLAGEHDPLAAMSQLAVAAPAQDAATEATPEVRQATSDALDEVLGDYAAGDGTPSAQQLPPGQAKASMRSRSASTLRNLIRNNPFVRQLPPEQVSVVEEAVHRAVSGRLTGPQREAFVDAMTRMFGRRAPEMLQLLRGAEGDAGTLSGDVQDAMRAQRVTGSAASSSADPDVADVNDAESDAFEYGGDEDTLTAVDGDEGTVIDGPTPMHPFPLLAKDARLDDLRDTAQRTEEDTRFKAGAPRHRLISAREYLNDYVPEAQLKDVRDEYLRKIFNDRVRQQRSDLELTGLSPEEATAQIRKELMEEMRAYGEDAFWQKHKLLIKDDRPAEEGSLSDYEWDYLRPTGESRDSKPLSVKFNDGKVRSVNPLALTTLGFRRMHGTEYSRDMATVARAFSEGLSTILNDPNVETLTDASRNSIGVREGALEISPETVVYKQGERLIRWGELQNLAKRASSRAARADGVLLASDNPEENADARDRGRYMPGNDDVALDVEARQGPAAEDSRINGENERPSGAPAIRSLGEDGYGKRTHEADTGAKVGSVGGRTTPGRRGVYDFTGFPAAQRKALEDLMNTTEPSSYTRFPDSLKEHILTPPDPTKAAPVEQRAVDLASKFINAMPSVSEALRRFVDSENYGAKHDLVDGLRVLSGQGNKQAASIVRGLTALADARSSVDVRSGAQGPAPSRAAPDTAREAAERVIDGVRNANAFRTWYRSADAQTRQAAASVVRQRIEMLEAMAQDVPVRLQSISRVIDAAQQEQMPKKA